MKKACFLIIFLLALSGIINAASITVTQLSLQQQPHLQLTFQLSDRGQYKSFLLKNPDRLVIDFMDAKNTISLKQTAFHNSLIKTMRISSKKNDALRYVFDLSAPVKILNTTLAPKKSGYQLTINLAAAMATTSTALNTTVSAPIPAISQPKLRNTIIVIDPGHGGQDPGATGPLHTHEKNVTLAIGLKLRDALQTLPGIKVYMTRSSDVYPSLGQRLALARKVNADMYISIHADAYRNHSAHGATIFALSQGRATSVAGRWIAEKENQSELLGGVDLADKSYLLRSVLVDLSQTATIGSSLKLGTNVLNNLRPIAKLHSRRVEQASLYVLTSPDIPAILVETGFISNRDEEKLLRSADYQATMAMAIKTGVETYLLQNPIPNTTFSAKVSGIQYIAKPGDTVASIAAKYRMRVNSLKNINVFQNNAVVAGQVVRIPTQNNS